MAARLVNLYPVHCAVEIFFMDEWQPGIVVEHAHPAVWVRVNSGVLLFITNRRHIRKLSHDER